jgi:hypothetical protein
MFDLNIFGKNLVVKDKNKNKITTSDKQTFIDLVDTFYMTHQRSLKVEKEHGLKLEKYDTLFYILIENLFFTHYGEWQGELILWYIYDREDENGDLYPMMLYDEVTQEESEIIIKNSNELYSLIQKINKKIKNKNKK